MLIRLAEPEDARAVAEIHVEAWRAAYASILPEAFLASLSVASRKAFWAQFLAEKRGDLQVAIDGERMRGWINIGPCRDQDAAAREAEIWALYVSPEVWATGVGRELWASAQASLFVKGYRHCRLWVLAQNDRAIRFYQAAGFERDEIPAKTFELGGATVAEIRLSCCLSAA
jgi:ribosomal protein S18 acetylase RimI-like enzyme